MPQNPSQSPEEQLAAISAVASKLSTVLEAIEAEEAENALAELSDEPSDESAEATAPEKKSPRRRVSRKEAREKLKSRVESIPGFDRHSRKCQICNHPDMEELEDEFINWASARWIKKAFHLRDESAIYRHARAAGLGALRRENLSMVVEKVLQEVDHLDTPTVAEVLRGVRILARLDSRGQWVFAPNAAQRNQVMQAVASGHLLPENNIASDSRRLARENSSLQPPACPPWRASSLQNSNRQTLQELESPATHTKQPPEVISNRQ